MITRFPYDQAHEAAVAHHLRVGGYDPYNSWETQVLISWELDPLEETQVIDREDAEAAYGDAFTMSEAQEREWARKNFVGDA